MREKKYSILLPVWGTVIFIVLYILATFFYPGGSQLNKNSTGFSWLNNYWCNLLNDRGINGKPNPAQPIAVTSMFVLCITLSIFWFLFPIYARIHTITRVIISVSGIAAMAIALLLFSHINHDLVTNLASALGLVATGGVFFTLYKMKWYGLFIAGFVNLLLVVVNNYLYYSSDLIVYLPLVQKITFAAFLFWICGISIKFYRAGINT